MPPAAPDQSRRLEGVAGKGPCPPGKTRWALSVTARITSQRTNELFTEMGHLKCSAVLVTVTEMKESQECNVEYKSQMLRLALSCESRTGFSHVASAIWRWIYVKILVNFTQILKITRGNVKQAKRSRTTFRCFSSKSPLLLGAILISHQQVHGGGGCSEYEGGGQAERGRIKVKTGFQKERKRHTIWGSNEEMCTLCYIHEGPNKDLKKHILPHFSVRLDHYKEITSSNSK